MIGDISPNPPTIVSTRRQDRAEWLRIRRERIAKIVDAARFAQSVKNRRKP